MADHSYIGEGKVYLRPYVGGGLRYVGKNEKLRIDIQEETQSLRDIHDPVGGILEMVSRISQVKVSLSLVEFSPDNLALAMAGSQSQSLGGVITGEVQTVYPGCLCPLDHPFPSAITLLAEDGVSSATWGALADFQEGDFVQPVLGNGRFYKCLATGQSGATEPAWPETLGQIVADGDLSWVDMGTIEKLEGVDFLATGAGLFIPASTSLEEGRGVRVDYTYGATSQVEALLAPGMEITLVFDGVNSAQDNRPRVVDLHRVRIGPAQYIALQGDAFGRLELEGYLLKDQARNEEGVSCYFKESSPWV